MTDHEKLAAAYSSIRKAKQQAWELALRNRRPVREREQLAREINTTLDSLTIAVEVAYRSSGP